MVIVTILETDHLACEVEEPYKVVLIPMLYIIPFMIDPSNYEFVPPKCDLGNYDQMKQERQVCVLACATNYDPLPNPLYSV